MSFSNTDLSTHIERERVLGVTFLRSFNYRPKMGIVNNRKFGVRSKIYFNSKTAQDCGNRSADSCLVMQAVGQAGHYLAL